MRIHGPERIRNKLPSLAEAPCSARPTSRDETHPLLAVCPPQNLLAAANPYWRMEVEKNGALLPAIRVGFPGLNSG